MGEFHLARITRAARLPGSRAPAGISGPVDEPLDGALICIRRRRLSDARGNPGLRLIGNIAQKFNLDLVRRVKAVGGAVCLIEGPEGVGADAMKVEIITAIDRARSSRAGTMAACGAVVPIALGEPSVPAFVHEIAGAGGRIRIQDAR